MAGFLEEFKLKGTSKNVIPVKTGIQKPLISLDSRLRGSDKLVIIRGSLKGEKRWKDYIFIVIERKPKMCRRYL